MGFEPATNEIEPDRGLEEPTKTEFGFAVEMEELIRSTSRRETPHAYEVTP